MLPDADLRPIALAGVLPIEIRSQPACVICAEPAPEAASYDVATLLYRFASVYREYGLDDKKNSIYDGLVERACTITSAFTHLSMSSNRLRHLGSVGPISF